MTNQALILGCGNIASSHVRALKKLGFEISAYDFDERKAEFFSDYHSIRKYSQKNPSYDLISICVPVDHRDSYINHFLRILDNSNWIVVEKPIRNLHGICHDYVTENINRIWTPYLRIFGLPKLKKINHLRVCETRELINSSDTYWETVFDLFPHWLSVVSNYEVYPTEYEFKNEKDMLRISLFNKEDKPRSAEIIFKKGSTEFMIYLDGRQQKTPSATASFWGIIQNPLFHYNRIRGGGFLQFYKKVLKNSPHLRKICDGVFELTKWIQIDGA